MQPSALFCGSRRKASSEQLILKADVLANDKL
jgi:hypothetical protein